MMTTLLPAGKDDLITPMQQQWKPYSRYRSSGIAWIEQVPSHWITWKASHAFRLIGSGTTPSTDDVSNFEGDVPWVTTSELRETVIFDTVKKVPSSVLNSHSALKLYEPGALLIAMYGATIGRLGILGVSACTNQACCALSQPIHLDTRFTFYWLLASKPFIILQASGGGQPNINQETVRSLRIPAPPLDEQRAIAGFLDRETAKVDALVEKKQRLIELLQEKRAALISHAVTRGLDPDVPMKDSGVEWLGDIPAHWEITKLGRLMQMYGGSTPSMDTPAFWNGDVPWVSPKDMKASVIIQSEDHVTRSALKQTSLRLLEPPAVLIVVRGMILAHTLPVATISRPVTINQDMKALIPRSSIGAEYLRNGLIGMSKAILSLVDESSHGTKKLETEVLKNLPVPLPPLDEQDAIDQHITGQTAAIDQLVDKIQEHIDRLHEYRTALISAAVTGKIDVRGEVNVS